MFSTYLRWVLALLQKLITLVKLSTYTARHRIIEIEVYWWEQGHIRNLLGLRLACLSQSTTQAVHLKNQLIFFQYFSWINEKESIYIVPPLRSKSGLRTGGKFEFQWWKFKTWEADWTVPWAQIRNPMWSTLSIVKHREWSSLGSSKLANKMVSMEKSPGER